MSRADSAHWPYRLVHQIEASWWPQPKMSIACPTRCSTVSSTLPQEDRGVSLRVFDPRRSGNAADSGGPVDRGNPECDRPGWLFGSQRFALLPVPSHPPAVWTLRVRRSSCVGSRYCQVQHSKQQRDKRQSRHGPPKTTIRDRYGQTHQRRSCVEKELIDST